MGRDKAFVELGGRVLVRRAADALEAAGAAPVLAVGGDAPALRTVGLSSIDDRWPGEGPLGGLLTALTAAPLADTGIVVVLTCDLAAIESDDVAALVAALVAAPEVDAAAPRSAGHVQLLTAAWRPRAATALLDAFEGGERSVRRAVASRAIAVATVVGVEEAHLVDLDTPDDVLHAQRRARPAG